jgi:transcriptional regulator with XRE-family HTH domain
MVRSTARATELGAFLRSWRTALDPGAVGLATEGVRRTAGLRREEIARLAGISQGYYVRLEQGRAPNPSTSVLNALARALRLSVDERAHLFALAGDRAPDTGLEELTPAAGQMLELLTEPTAAYVISRHSDVLTWNDSAAALFSHLVEGPERPNNVRYVFTDPEARERFLDWDEVAADSVAHLRAATGHCPDDAGLVRLVAEMGAASAEFREFWVARELRHKVSGRKNLFHPEVGRLVLDYVVLAAPMSVGQRLVAYSATPGSTSHRALTGLLTTAARRRETA